jgi:hypothetical protein
VSVKEESATMSDIWSQLAAPVPENAISWRQDGKTVKKGEKYFVRYVAYIDASTVRERLDTVVPGEWNLSMELLPPVHSADEDGPLCAFKARLEIRGVVREDVGLGRDYKSAATDAFKRAAVRFGVAHELYSYERNWVEVYGDSRNARPMEDPAAAYARRNSTETQENGNENDRFDFSGLSSSRSSRLADEPQCPKCGGRTWDNRQTKRNPRAPDYRCRDRSCDGVIWPEISSGISPAA